MTHFTVNKHGSRVFEHEGWLVRIGAEWIGVTSPCADHEVMVDADGLWVSGGSSDGCEEFTIPWAVIEAVVEARAIIG